MDNLIHQYVSINEQNEDIRKEECMHVAASSSPPPSTSPSQFLRRLCGKSRCLTSVNEFSSCSPFLCDKKGRGMNTANTENKKQKLTHGGTKELKGFVISVKNSFF
ncbi:hypothetical protein QTP88_004943 [Uroleucon formosanum]